MSLPSISCALPADEPDLRRLMREIDMPGGIGMAFEREPNFYHAVEIEGDDHRVVVARLDEAVVAMACLTRRALFVNGMAQPVNYLSTARVERNWRGRRVTPRGLAALGEIIRREPDTFCFCTLVKDNAQAHSFLMGRHRLIPKFEVREQLCTFVVPTWRARKTRQAPLVRQAGAEDLHPIVDCLRRNGARRQFAVAWTAEDLLDEGRTRGLALSDFFVAEQTGRIVGCIAIWDQSAFKQSIVTGYSGYLKTFRHGINAVAPILNLPRLPQPGTHFHHVYLSHLAVDDDDLAMTTALLDAGFLHAHARGAANVTFGLSERDPRLEAVGKHFGGIRYWTELCTIAFPGSEELAGTLDDRPAHLEIATL